MSFLSMDARVNLLIHMCFLACRPPTNVILKMFIKYLYLKYRIYLHLYEADVGAEIA